LLTSVSVANARRAKTLTSVQHLNRNYPAEIVDVHKQNEFIQSSLAAKAFTSCPNELRTSKSYLRAIPTIFFYLSLLKVFTPKHPYCQSRQHQAIQFNSGYTCCNLLFTLSAEPLIGLIDIGIQLEVIQDLPLITDQEYSSHYRRKIRALYAKVHLNLSRKVQPSFNFVYGLWL